MRDNWLAARRSGMLVTKFCAWPPTTRRMTGSAIPASIKPAGYALETYSAGVTMRPR